MPTPRTHSATSRHPRAPMQMAEFDSRLDAAMGGTNAQMNSALRTALREEGTFLDPDDRRPDDRSEDHRPVDDRASPGRRLAAGDARGWAVERPGRLRPEARRRLRLPPGRRRGPAVPARSAGGRHLRRRLRPRPARGAVDDPGVPGQLAQAGAVPHPPVRGGDARHRRSRSAPASSRSRCPRPSWSGRSCRRSSPTAGWRTWRSGPGRRRRTGPRRSRRLRCQVGTGC